MDASGPLSFNHATDLPQGETVLRRMFLVALGAWLIAPPALAADKPKTKQAKKQAKKKSRKPARETREGIARKLEGFAESHVRSLNKNLRPNKTHIKIEKTENSKEQ